MEMKPSVTITVSWPPALGVEGGCAREFTVERDAVSWAIKNLVGEVPVNEIRFERSFAMHLDLKSQVLHHDWVATAT